jgi:hypothetical protein
VLGPVVMKDRAVYVDGRFDRAVVIGVAGDATRIDTFSIGRRAIAITPTPDRTGVAIVTKGHEAVKRGEVDEDPGLYVLRVTETDVVTAPIRYELGSPFDRISIAADGSLAVAYFSEGGPDEEGLFRNPNEIAVIDLMQPPSDENPLLRTIRSFGNAPDGVVLSPPMTIPGAEDPEPRTFAFVLAPNAVTILDATHPERREVTVRLTLGGTAVTPRELAFAPARGAAYLRADGARDVLEIVLSGDIQADELDNDFQPALAELGAGAAPADVAVYDDFQGRRWVLSATPASRQLTVIDAETAEFTIVPIDDPVDRILLLPPEQPLVAVLASIAIRAPRIHLVDLTNIDHDLLRPEVRTLSLTEPIFDVVGVPGQGRALVVHDADRTVLGVLDPLEATVQPLEGLGRLDAYDFTAGGSHLIGATAGVSRVGFVDMANLHPTDVRLDDQPRGVFALASGAVLVDHGDPFGRASWLPSPDARRTDTRVLSGFLIDGLFDEEP